MIGQTFSHYRIVEKLGEGGMGLVYRAEDTKLRRTVALKFLISHLVNDTGAKQRFLREAQAVAALNHPNVCTIYEIDEAQGQTFIVMEFIEGESLENKARHGPLNINEALSIAIQVAEGLQEAHDKGVIHRDIKPQNLMLTKRGQVKIMDFGLAHLADRTKLTKTGTTMGTPVYISPEQAQGADTDHRSDIWSFGCVLYEMIAGRPPFVEEHELALLYAILNETPEDVTALRPEVPAEIALIVRKALAKRPNERYSGIGVLIQDLRYCLTNQAETAQVSSEGKPPQSTEGKQLLPEGERVQVTLVASSLGGYTDLVEQLSPEEVDPVKSEIRSRAFEIAEHHDGIVNHFSGEEIVTAFGVTTAYEDHFSRAASAAVTLRSAVREIGAEIKSKTGFSLWLNSGIDTGLVMARRSEDPDQPYQIVGGPAKLAASLARLGKPEEILISPESQRLLAPFFETEACPPLRVEGTAKSIIPYLLGREFGRQSRLDAAQQLGLSAYTGRDVELETLRGCFSLTLQGEGQLVSVVGEAGLGKSRLLYEFRQRLAGEDVTVLQGLCQPRGSGPFLPFVEALRSHLLPDGELAQQDAVQCLVARIRELDAGLEPYIPVCLHLLSLHSDAHPMPEHADGTNLRLAILEALSAIFTVTALRRPVVLLLENWHWSDMASQDALNQLAELIPANPLLVVVTSRPECPQDWSGLAHHTLVRLRPLKGTSALRIAQSVLAVQRFPEDVAAVLHERTGGNPFFLEEICRALREDGTLVVQDGQASLSCPLGKLQWPSTVQAVIRARLNQLERGPRRLLRVAAVIGREFGQLLLQRLLGGNVELGSALNSLKAAGLVQQTRVLPEPTYRFKHALIQDVVYDSLLPHQQKTLHGEVGEAIEALAPSGGAEEHAEILAHHFSQTRNWSKAIRYGRQVVQRSSRFNLLEALETAERVESWIEKLPDDEERQNAISQVLLDQERICETLGQPARQEELIQRLLSILIPSGDSAALAETYIRQGDLYAVRGRFEEGEAALQEALRISRARSMSDLEMRALRSVGHNHFRQDRFDEAIAILEDLINRDRKEENTRALLIDINSMCGLLTRLGNYRRALEYAKGVLASTEAQRYQQLWIPFHFTFAEIYRALGDDVKALYYYERNMELGLGSLKTWGFWKPTVTLTAMSNVHLRQGNLPESLRCAKEAVELSRKTRQADSMAAAYRQLGAVLVSMDRHDEAVSNLQEAGALYAQLEDRKSEAQMHRMAATLLEGHGNLAGAMSSWERARETEQQGQNASGEIEALDGLGRTARKLGLPQTEALRYYGAAIKLAEIVGDQAKLGDLHNTVGILTWQQGEYESALAHYQQALRICQDRADRIHEGLMLNSIGASLRKLGRYEEARVTLERALQLHRENGKRLLEGHALAVLGDIHFDLSRFDESIACYEESLAIRKEIADYKGEAWMLHHLARGHLAHQDHSKARDFLAQASKMAADQKIEDLGEACRRLLDS